MSVEVLLDTNILVYAYDRSELRKQQRAWEILDALAEAEAGTVSTQVLAEFFVTLRGKLAAQLPLAMAADRVEHHSRTWTVRSVTGTVVREALRGVREHRLNYWDAQIWAVARLNGIPVLFSEDFSDGALVEGVRFVNPFHPGFQIADWI